MGRNNNRSHMRERKITPVSGMREFLGDTAFRTFMVAALLFSFLHQRVISVELAGGGGGIWCGLGIPALLCLAISALLAFFGAKARILPALVPIIGLGGMGASAVMFFVIILSRMRFSGGLLGVIQEITMLAFLAAWYVLLFLMMYGYHVSNNGKTNMFFCAMAMFQQGKYRFWRLVMSCKQRDFSLAFKGQYFGIYHMKSDYQNSVRKTWLYFYSIFAIMIAMIVYKWIVG